jgi:hypothetical protein
MVKQNLDNKPLYYSTYSFIAQVDGKKMEFVSEKEYEEYVNTKKPIQILKRYVSDGVIPHFRMKVVLYKRTTDGTYFVYRVIQYFNHEPDKEVYTFDNYCDACRMYELKGGK